MVFCKRQKIELFADVKVKAYLLSLRFLNTDEVCSYACLLDVKLTLWNAFT